MKHGDIPNDDVKNEAVLLHSHKGCVSHLFPRTKKKDKPWQNSCIPTFKQLHFNSPELLLELPQYVVLSEKKVPAISSDQVTPPTHKGGKTRLPLLKELYMALCLYKCFNWHCIWLRNLVIASTRFSWTHMAFMYLRRKNNDSTPLVWLRKYSYEY